MSKIFNCKNLSPFWHTGVYGAKYHIDNHTTSHVMVTKKDGKIWYLPLEDLKALAIIFLKDTVLRFITKLCDEEFNL